MNNKKIIAILPFILDSKTKAIMSVLTTKKSDKEMSSVMFLEGVEASDTESIYKFLREGFRIIVDEDKKTEFLDNLFFLGDYGSDAELFNSKDRVPLYGLNLTNITNKMQGKAIEKIFDVEPYANLVKDANIDVFMSAGLFMLISYLA